MIRLPLVALGVAVIGLSGCNSLTRDAIDTMHLAISGPEPVIAVEHVHAVNAPALLAQLGTSEAMLISPGSGTGIAEWHGLEQMLLTHNGRLVHSAGLPVDVIAPLVSNDPFLAGLDTLETDTEVTRLVDLPGRYQTGLRQHARYRVAGIEPVVYMNTEYALLRIDEMIHMPELDFRATNQYWVEPATGLVRRSIQHVAPDMPPLRLTLAKTQGDLHP